MYYFGEEIKICREKINARRKVYSRSFLLQIPENQSKVICALNRAEGCAGWGQVIET